MDFSSAKLNVYNFSFKLITVYNLTKDTNVQFESKLIQYSKVKNYLISTSYPDYIDTFYNYFLCSKLKKIFF